MSAQQPQPPQTFIATITIPTPQPPDLPPENSSIIADGDHHLTLQTVERDGYTSYQPLGLQTVIDEINIPVSYTILAPLPALTSPGVQQQRLDEVFETTAQLSTFTERGRAVMRQLQIRHMQLQNQHTKLQEEVALLWEETRDHRRCTKPLTDIYEHHENVVVTQLFDQAFYRHVLGRHELRPVTLEGMATASAAAAAAGLPTHGRPRSRSVTGKRVWTGAELEGEMHAMAVMEAMNTPIGQGSGEQGQGQEQGRRRGESQPPGIEEDD